MKIISSLRFFLSHFFSMLFFSRLFFLKRLFVVIFLFLPFFLISFEPRHTYLTWMEEETYNHITVTVHTDGLTGPLELFYNEINPAIPVQYTGSNHLIQKPSHFINNRFLYHFNLEKLRSDQTYIFVVGNQKIGFSNPKKFKTVNDVLIAIGAM